MQETPGSYSPKRPVSVKAEQENFEKTEKTATPGTKEKKAGRCQKSEAKSKN